MKRRHQEDFLREILADEALDALRENSLTGGLAALHSRRRRRAACTTVLATVPLLIAAAILLRPAPSISPAAQSRVATADASLPAIKIYPAVVPGNLPPITAISDEELLSLYSDRAVGLLGKAGQQKLVLFDQPPTTIQ